MMADKQNIQKFVDKWVAKFNDADINYLELIERQKEAYVRQ